MKVIHTDLAPAAIGPYSQAIVSGGFVFTAGQGGIDPATGDLVSDSVVEQAEQVIPVTVNFCFIRDHQTF